MNTSMTLRWLLAVSSIALAISCTGTAVIVTNQAIKRTCDDQKALTDGIQTILKRSTDRIPQYVRDGIITEAQAQQAYADNTKAQKDIRDPKC